MEGTLAITGDASSDTAGTPPLGAVAGPSPPRGSGGSPVAHPLPLPLPPARLPRSAVSICYALDQLELELEAEEAGSSGEEEAAPGDAAGRSADDIASHPLDFTAQYPRITIATTAALPWLTGTAVNPALRAAYLWHKGHAVALLVPWLSPEVQPRLFPDHVVYASQEEQVEGMLQAIRSRVPFELPADAVKFVFYAGRYDAALGSILPEEDLQPLVPRPVDCIILEEPEHLTWYHTGKRWTRAFPRSVPVVGVMHTNYIDYARRVAGEAAAMTIGRLNSFLCRQHCHKVIKLSDAVQTLPRQETCFVHGVADAFLAVGRSKAAGVAGPAAQQAAQQAVLPAEEASVAEAGEALQASSIQGTLPTPQAAAAAADLSEALPSSSATVQQEEEDAEPSPPAAPAAGATASPPAPRFTRGAYFLGKALYAKGFRELLDRFEEHTARCNAVGAPHTPADVYGKGEQLEDIKADAARRGLALHFHGAKDHMSPDMAEFRVFINPSTSDVVATTSAEALAMGKWLLVPRHPCNDFLSTFPNCLVYDTSQQFSTLLEHALEEDPAPLSPEDAARLGWDAATDRFLHCCASVELGRGKALARMAAKTGWVGFNAGHSVVAVVTRAMQSVQRGFANVAPGGAAPAPAEAQGEADAQPDAPAGNVIGAVGLPGMAAAGLVGGGSEGADGGPKREVTSHALGVQFSCV